MTTRPKLVWPKVVIVLLLVFHYQEASSQTVRDPGVVGSGSTPVMAALDYLASVHSQERFIPVKLSTVTGLPMELSNDQRRKVTELGFEQVGDAMECLPPTEEGRSQCYLPHGHIAVFVIEETFSSPDSAMVPVVVYRQERPTLPVTMAGHDLFVARDESGDWDVTEVRRNHSAFVMGLLRAPDRN